MRHAWVVRIGVIAGLVLGTAVALPRTISADVTSAILSEYNFFEGEDSSFPIPINEKLNEINSPLTTYSERVDDEILNAGEILWLYSQNNEMFISAKVLFTILKVEGELDQLPDGLFRTRVRELAVELWDYHRDYDEGERSFQLASGTTVTVKDDSNGATYALARYFGKDSLLESQLNRRLMDWEQAYRDIFARNPLETPLEALAAPDIAPFMRLPFDQPTDNFIRLTSFFDHNAPNYSKNGYIHRFDGQILEDDGSCWGGVTCYDGHNGLDYATPDAYPIVSVESGTVVYKIFDNSTTDGDGTDSGLIIDHGNGYRTTYWHMDPIESGINLGSYVSKGQKIGECGTLGMSTGNHLHFGLRFLTGTYSTKDVDPYGYWSTSVTDPHGDSQWMWEGDLTADDGEAQSQFFFHSYWTRDAAGWQGDAWHTASVETLAGTTNWGMWGTYISAPGEYDVMAYFPDDATATTSARYKIFHSGGMSTVTINQAANGGDWVYLGTYTFSRGGAAVILTDYTGEKGKPIYFDAIRWEFDSALPPIDMSLSSISILETTPIGTAVAQISTTDPDFGDQFTYSLVTGTGSTDNAAFSIDEDLLVLQTALDYETKSNYNIRLRTTDLSGMWYEEAFVLHVNDGNEAPTNININGSTIPENSAIGTQVSTFDAIDPDTGDTFTYSLVSGSGSTDNASFNLTGNVLTSKVVFNYEAKSSLAVRVRATDQDGAYVEKAFGLSVLNRNDIPTNLSLSSTSLAENSAIGTTVGNFTTTDQDTADTFTYTLVSGTGSADNALFGISGSSLRTAAVLDYETRSTYSIRVRSTDSGNATIENIFTITLTPVNENAPTNINLSNASVAENSPTGTTVGTLTAVDSDIPDSHTFGLVSGTGSTDNASFVISGNNLLTNAVFNREAKSSYSIRIRATDASSKTYEKIFTITVANVNEAPTNLALSATSVAENLPSGSMVGALSTTDPDGDTTFTYALVTGTGSTDNAQFRISGGQLLTNTVFNYEARNSYSVRIRTTDGGGLTYEQAFTITITDANDAPTNLALSKNTISEGLPAGTTVGSLTPTDADSADTHTYTLVSGTGSTDNAAFSISGRFLNSAQVFDAAVKTAYSVRIRVTDNSGGWYEKAFAITVTPYNYAPTGITLTPANINENQPSGTNVGVLDAVDLNSADTHTFTLVSGTGGDDNGLFTISGATLKSAASFNKEADDSLSIRVRATDGGGLWYESVLVIAVNNVNEAPGGFTMNDSLVTENLPVGTEVGVFSAVDVDAGGSHTYSLVAGAGDTDNALFGISGAHLHTAAVFDYEARSSYSIRVRITDQGGLWAEQTITISIDDGNDPPLGVSLSNNNVAENSVTPTQVGLFSSQDPDSNDTPTYSLVSGTGSTNNNLFIISGNRLLATSSFDFEAATAYSIRVRSTDSGGMWTENVFTINVTPVNEFAPTAINLDNLSIKENYPPGSFIGTLSVADLDLGDSHTYSLTAGSGDTNNGLFEIVNNQLVAVDSLDYELDPSLEIRLKVTDSGGLSFERTVIITVIDQAEIYIPNIW